jgi:hypothetical protein
MADAEGSASRKVLPHGGWPILPGRSTPAQAIARDGPRRGRVPYEKSGTLFHTVPEPSDVPTCGATTCLASFPRLRPRRPR